jgi:hypothetical protein
MMTSGDFGFNSGGDGRRRQSDLGGGRKSAEELH